MALNSNHTFEDLEDIKCSIVEKNCSSERVAFLRKILEYNNYKIVVVPSPPPKTTPNADTGEIQPVTAPETFTMGVTDLSFSPVKAIYNRELKSPSGKTVTPDYWRQLETDSDDSVWYWK